MRTISVSTDVFARIWGLREDGEETENEILSRVLSDGAPKLVVEPAEVGFHDPRYGVSFRAGFEIFRSYLGSEFKARARGGRWVLDDGRTATSLNELSRLVGAKTENAWANWFWRDETGHRRSVSDLRSPETISTRKPSSSQNLEFEDKVPQAKSQMHDATWRDDVLSALTNLGGEADLDAIYREVRRLRTSGGRSTPPSFEAVIRKTLEENSSDSDAFRQGPDLFRMPRGKGVGRWALR